MPRRAHSDNRSAGHRYEDAMRRALRLAEATRPHPNPRVGAVVIAPDESIAAARAHETPGEPHAEALALADAGTRARGATLVVTLEPCDHHGRTPPCSEAIIAAGVTRVVVGAIDPDPRVAGTGVAKLRNAGIAVTTGVIADEVIESDPGYFHHRRTGRPLVTVKLAATLDGQTAAADASSQWITGDEARRDVHRLRASSDAVAVGAGTLRDDDPRLDVRIDGYDGHQPQPIVVAGSRPLPAERRLYGRRPLVYAPTAEAAPPLCTIVEMPGDGGVDLHGMLKDLGSRGVLELLVEGGPTLAGALAHAGLVDQYLFYFGAKLAAGSGRPMFSGDFTTMTDAVSLDVQDVTVLGGDLRVRAVPVGEVA